jgi:hypothetical protein
VLDLRECLAAGFSGEIVYYSPWREPDGDVSAFEDDILRLEIDTAVIDYHNFCNCIFPRLIESFDAYRGVVYTDAGVKAADQGYIQTLEDIRIDPEGRGSVYRIWPVKYFDDALCRCAFGISAAKVVRRAGPRCERAEILNGGALLIVTSSSARPSTV